jgi:hypothetical protein
VKFPSSSRNLGSGPAPREHLDGGLDVAGADLFACKCAAHRVQHDAADDWPRFIPDPCRIKLHAIPPLTDEVRRANPGKLVEENAVLTGEFRGLRDSASRSRTERLVELR